MSPRSWLPAALFAAVPLAACSVELAPGAVVGDASVRGAIALSEPAPATGLVITLTSSTPSAQVRSHLMVPPGESTAIFTISTTPVTSSTKAVITAAAGTCTAAAGVTVHPASLSELSISETTPRANAGLRGAVTLNGPAPSTGAVVQLQSSDLLVTVPEYVTVPAGEISVSFPLYTGVPQSRNTVAVTATYGASVQSALLSVLPGI